MLLMNFMAAVDRLGATNSERAKRIRMTGRRLEQWKKNGPPRLLLVLADNPDLLTALMADSRKEAEQEAA
ncbi:MAG: hypothetical protein WCJ76_14990 [Comamonadaceae bacterium]